MRSSSENRFLKQLNLALCSSSCFKYIPLNYNLQLHHKFHSKRNIWTIKVHVSLCLVNSVTSDRHGSGVWLPLYLHLASGYISHDITRAAIRHSSCTATWAIGHNRKEQNKCKKKCLKIGPPSSDYRPRLPDPSLLEGRLPRSHGCIWKGTRTATRSHPELGSKLKGQVWAHAERMPEIPQHVEDVQTQWYRPLWHWIFTENRWRTSRCEALTPQTQTWPFRSPDRRVSTLM